MPTYYGTSGSDTMTVATGKASQYNDLIYGFAGNDYINGSNGNDTIYGGDGNDYIDGGYGFDYIHGGSGIDTTTYGFYSGGIVANLNTGKVSFPGNSTLTDTLVSIENLYGSKGNDTIYGNGLGNVLSGDNGNDYIYGYGGNDIIYGGNGNDYLNGGLGADNMYGGLNNDRYVVDNTGDKVIEYSNQGIDTVYSYISSYTLTSNVENLSLYGSAITGAGNGLANIIYGNGNNNYLYGYAGNDTIYGYGGNDYINGGTGADKMYGGTGNDRYIVDNTGDKVTEYSNQGIDSVYSYISSYTLTGHVENLYLYGSAITGAGNGLANTIYGNSQANYLYGYAGNDTIYGYGGNDYINGGAGDDLLSGGTGNDYVYSGHGKDTIRGYGGTTNEVDTLVGYNDGQPTVGDATDKDLFILGDTTKAFYDGDGASGYARINNFDWRDNDEIQVYGAASDYTLSYNSSTGDTSILLDGDLLAVVTDVYLISSDLVSA
ncbi:MAG: calcium-binding protein [Leptolyngbyaceae cyanobacterium]